MPIKPFCLKWLGCNDMAGHLEATKIPPKLFKYKTWMKFRYCSFDVHDMETWVNEQCSSIVWYRKYVVHSEHGKPYSVVMELWFKNKNDAMLFKLMFFRE